MSHALMSPAAGSIVKGAAGRRPAPSTRVHHVSRRCSVSVRAQQQQQEEKSGLAKFSDSIGMPTDEGVGFGFLPFNEVFVGRAAMIGFVSSIVAEFATGRGTLQQLGIQTPSDTLLIVLCAFFGGATILGTANTVSNLAQKKMSRKEINRYKSFLGLNKEGDWMAESVAMKKRGDFTTPGDDLAAIRAAKVQGAPIDAVLNLDDRATAEATAKELKAGGGVLTLTKEQEAAEIVAANAESKAKQTVGPNVSLQARKDIEELMFFNDEMKYARNVEIQNGRAAMLGFLAAILVEAATGNGIIGQLIVYLKLSGILGAKSGF